MRTEKEWGERNRSRGEDEKMKRNPSSQPRAEFRNKFASVFTAPNIHNYQCLALIPVRHSTRSLAWCVVPWSWNFRGILTPEDAKVREREEEREMEFLRVHLVYSVAETLVGEQDERRKKKRCTETNKKTTEKKTGRASSRSEIL